MEKQERGVLYIVWGSKIDVMLQRSLESVRAVHPELPIEVIRVEADPGTPQSLLVKTEMFERSPFRETLYLDADAVVLDRLDFGFAKARQFGLAACICEAPWARRYAGLSDKGDMIEYNTGVLFFTAGSKPIFDAWREIAPNLDSSIRFYENGQLKIMSANDQASFSAAIEQCGISPFVLPRNWNFRATVERVFVGPIRIWHSYEPVTTPFLEAMAYYRRKNSIIQNHVYHLPGDPGPASES